jgi:RimJ/RimL family protein N-acetyltransferase
VNIVLETPRLLLRQMTEADAGALVALNRNPNVMRYILSEPPTRTEEDALSALHERIFPQYALGLGRWACIEKSSGAFLGWCGLKYLAEEGEYDLGYRFAEEHWGKGYATEAASATRDYARKVLSGKRVVGKAACDNVASCRVLSKIGLTFEGHEEHDGLTIAVYVLDP